MREYKLHNPNAPPAHKKPVELKAPSTFDIGDSIRSPSGDDYVVIESSGHQVIAFDRDSKEKVHLNLKDGLFTASSLPDLCTTCQLYFCQCTTTTESMNPVTFTELASYVDGQVIPCVKGNLHAIFDSTVFNGQHGPTTFQDAYLIDAANIEHKISLSGKHVIPKANIPDWKGKEIMITAKTGGRAMSGIKMQVRESGGKTYRTIKVSDTATITILTAGGTVSSGKPTPTAAAAQSQPSSRSPSSGGSRPQSTEGPSHPFEQRIQAFFSIYNHVYEENQKLPDHKRLSHDHVKDVSSTIFISFKAAYGMFELPYSGTGQDRPAATQEKEIPWREYKHPSHGKSLGELEKAGDAELLKHIRWAFAQTEGSLKAPPVKLWHEGVMKCAKEHFSIRKVDDAIICSVEAEDQSTRIQERFLAKLAQYPKPIPGEITLDILKNWDNFIKKVQAIQLPDEAAQADSDDEIPM